MLGHRVPLAMRSCTIPPKSWASWRGTSAGANCRRVSYTLFINLRIGTRLFTSSSRDVDRVEGSRPTNRAKIESQTRRTCTEWDPVDFRVTVSGLTRKWNVNFQVERLLPFVLCLSTLSNPIWVAWVGIALGWMHSTRLGIERQKIGMQNEIFTVSLQIRVLGCRGSWGSWRRY